MSVSSYLRRYSTGLEFLDRRLDGGLPTGSILAIVAPPSSQSELLLRQLVQSRPTLYISTHRPAAEVHRWAEAGTSAPVDLSVTRPDVSTLLESFPDCLDQFPSESFVILDRGTPLETESRETYLAFLDSLKRELEESDSVGVIHCPTTEANPPRRDLTLSRADMVWELELQSLSREIKTRLLVTKARYTRAVVEPIQLLLTDQVQIDTTRRIS